MRAEETRVGGRWIQRDRDEQKPAEKQVDAENHFKRWDFPCGYSVPVFPLIERLDDPCKK
jgi:hypothetical protein